MMNCGHAAAGDDGVEDGDIELTNERIREHGLRKDASFQALQPEFQHHENFIARLHHSVELHYLLRSKVYHHISAIFNPLLGFKQALVP